MFFCIDTFPYQDKISRYGLKRSDFLKYSFFVILAGCLWGLISIFIDLMNEAGFTSMQCVALRAFFTAFLLFIYILITDRSKFRIRIRHIPCFLGTGIMSIVFFNFCYFKCIELTGSAAVPALLMYTSPVFVILLSAVFFKERITARKVIAIVMTFIGLGIVTEAFSGLFAGSGSISLTAVLYGLGAGIGYALYSIFGKFVTDKYHPVTITFYTFLVAAAASVPVSGVAGNLSLLADTKMILIVLGLAFFSTVLPFLFYTKGLSGMEAGKAAVLATIEPVTAAVVGIFFFHEEYTVLKVAGMLLIIAAIIFLNTGKNPKKTAVKKKK